MPAPPAHAEPLDVTHFELVPTDQLYLDVHNPRTAEFDVGKDTSQTELIELYWRALAIDELVASISAYGFYPHEPLFVEPVGKRLVVIEGNRRLAAVKLLLDKTLRKRLRVEVADPSPRVLATLQQLPVVRTTRQKAWAVVGFKHINGPAKWSSFAKAEYIADTHDNGGISLDDIAAQIGDKHQTVRRMYRAMCVLRQAKREGLFDPSNSFAGRLAFTHLMTGLGYAGFQSYLGVTEESLTRPDPVPADNLPRLGEVLNWLYGDKQATQPAVVGSQNPDLKTLDAILKSADSVNELRKSRVLSAAYEISRGDAVLFDESLRSAKAALSVASGRLVTGFKPSRREQVDVAEEVVGLANDLEGRMRRLLD